MDVHPTKKVSIGIDPYPLRKPPTFWRLEVRSHLAFHEVATLPPKDLVRRAVVGRRIASRLRGMGKPWETVEKIERVECETPQVRNLGRNAPE